MVPIGVDGSASNGDVYAITIIGPPPQPVPDIDEQPPTNERELGASFACETPARHSLPEPAPRNVSLAASALVLPTTPTQSGMLHGLLSFAKVTLATTLIGGVLLLAAHDIALRLGGAESASQVRQSTSPRPSTQVAPAGNTTRPEFPAPAQLVPTAQTQSSLSDTPSSPPEPQTAAARHRRVRAAPRPELTTTSQTRGIPALPDRLDARQVSVHLSGLLSARTHPDLSLKLVVRPDGTVDAAQTQTSAVFGTFEARLLAHPFPPSAHGSGELVCHVVQGEQQPRCNPQ